MKASKRLALHLVEVAAKGVVPGIPLLLLIGLVGAGAWVVTSNVQGSRADWSVLEEAAFVDAQQLGRRLRKKKGNRRG